MPNRRPAHRCTPTMLAWLRDLAAGRNPYERRVGSKLPTRTNNPTQRALFQRGFTTILGDITDKGRQRLRDELNPPG